MVGSTKFCLKDKLLGASSCGTGRHGTAKHPVSWNALYVRFTDTQAYASPFLEVSSYSEEQIKSLLAKSYTISEWAALFQELENELIPDWFPKVTSLPIREFNQVLGLRPLSLLSPTHAGAENFNFQQIMSFDSSDSTQLVASDSGVTNWRKDVAPTEFLTYVEALDGRLSRFKTTISKPFCDIEASYRLLVADLKNFHYNVALLHDFVGAPVSLKGLDFKSV